MQYSLVIDSTLADRIADIQAQMPGETIGEAIQHDVEYVEELFSKIPDLDIQVSELSTYLNARLRNTTYVGFIVSDKGIFTPDVVEALKLKVSGTITVIALPS